VTVAISLSDDRSFLTNRSGPALPTSVDQALADPQVVHLHIGELATLSECPDLARNAKACGLSVSLDCSWDEALFGERSTRQLFGDIDLFLPNEKELRALLELRHSLQDAARQITALCPLVVVKQGAAGATAFFDDTTVSASAAHAELVDTTGAGDAFNAGFIAAWLAGENPRDCLISGNRMGGLAVQSMGGANNGDAAALLTHAV
ncbi:MAG: carbohydrate kinase family protein, partial [Paracoccaceae bacterium]